MMSNTTSALQHLIDEAQRLPSTTPRDVMRFAIAGYLIGSMKHLPGQHDQRTHGRDRNAKDPLGEWSAPLNAPDDVYYGYRGVNKTGVGFGATEGEGMYLARDKRTADFFSETGTSQRVKFIAPKHPMVVDREKLHILTESDEIVKPISDSDSDWTKYNKLAYQSAAKKNNWKGDEWDSDKVSHELTIILKKDGFDGVIVNTESESWVVLFDPHIVKASQELLSTKSFTIDQKDMLWKANDTTATKWEPKFSDAAVEAFDRDMREMLAIVNDAKAKAKEAKASISWQDTFLAILDYIQSGGSDNWRKTFAPVMQGVITEQGKRWAAQLGASFDVRNFFAEAWFDKYTLVFAQKINETTTDELATMFQQAQAEGWSIETMQKRMTTMFKQWSEGDIPKEEFEWYSKRMPPYRTEMIARTETIRASNAGSQQLFTEWGVQKHEWLSTDDKRTRDAHKGVNIDPKVVPIDEPFIVMGEKLMYPGDPDGSPANTINCRCTVLPVME